MCKSSKRSKPLSRCDLRNPGKLSAPLGTGIGVGVRDVNVNGVGGLAGADFDVAAGTVELEAPDEPADACMVSDGDVASTPLRSVSRTCPPSPLFTCAGPGGSGDSFLASVLKGLAC